MRVAAAAGIGWRILLVHHCRQRRYDIYWGAPSNDDLGTATNATIAGACSVVRSATACPTARRPPAATRLSTSSYDIATLTTTSSVRYCHATRCAYRGAVAVGPFVADSGTAPRATTTGTV